MIKQLLGWKYKSDFSNFSPEFSQKINSIKNVSVDYEDSFKTDRLGLLDNLSKYPYPVEDIYEKVKKLTMTSKNAVAALINCTIEVNRIGLKGDFVECGVWRGGSVLAMHIANERLNSKYWLYDSFEGMVPPSDLEDSIEAHQAFENYSSDEFNWLAVAEAEVRSNLEKFNAPLGNFIFVKGPVEETLKIKKNLPNSISILRLDTDWYNSTKIELEMLEPKVQKNGFIIIDDYGFWTGSRKATDDYFSSIKVAPFMVPLDSSAVLIRKTW